MAAVDFKDLLKAGVHFGHKTSFGNPKMLPYIWGAKNKVHLIDISKTAFLLEHAGKKLTDLTGNGGVVLWVGTKKPAQNIIAKVSTDLNMPSVINRWIGGTLSNFGQIKKAITRLLHLRDVLKKSNTYYTKKELVTLQKKVDRLEKNVGGIIDLEFPPAAIVVVDAKKEQSAIKEAASTGVPIIALVDTNTDPTGIDFVIPGNDDSPRSINCVVEYLAACAAEGKKIAEAKAAADKQAKATAKTAPKTVSSTPSDEDIAKQIAVATAGNGEDSEGGKRRAPTQTARPAARRPFVKKRD